MSFLSFGDQAREEESSVERDGDFSQGLFATYTYTILN
jgi:hypothetical protein